MSAWVIALGLGAGYLMNKNAKVQHRLESAVKKVNDEVERADPGPATEEIRTVQRTIPAADRNQDINIQDLTRADVQAIQKERDAAANAVVMYESPVIPQIEGVYLHYDNRGI